ncbi:substrate-binding domain-containing protein [Runella slithyformis]|uniref:histidine kinase n=1 Tax=Runella slithyformis (strain ATCC 29530 / DSM 19594 / LMG 11500 / NCIMB 11436 / LSU 4) TaxID=761193 RepID=A0A7U3ZI47_RUNSL|nr:substrate-binding domain-containing protein [Runella slithyformis]AEI47618.1 two component transcriptional regulator, AraC family [Runella slithyformis DSM 19594]
MRLRILLLLLWMGLSCQTPAEKKTYSIGFSQCTGGDEWRRVMLNDINRELTLYPDFRLIYKDAANSTATQLAQIKELVQQDIDLLIISPNETSPVLTAAIDEVFQKGIPVILLDRKITSESYNSFIGADNLEIGRMVGEALPTLLKKGGKIVEVWGLASSSPAQERHKGLIEGISKKPAVQIIGQLYGQWEQDTARKVALANLDILREADLVFAHNDVMALSVQQVCKEAGIRPLPLFVGIDGLPGPKSGLQKIMEGTLTATFLYPTGGEEAIETAARILAGKAAKREYVLNSIRIDRSNIKAIKTQSDKLLLQQQDIESLNQRIGQLNDTYASQKNALYVIITCLVLAVFLGIWALYLVRAKQLSNRKLELQNRQINEQKDKIEEVSNKARQATEEKLRFYSYISHEFRTPLSLILTPVEDLLNQKAISQKDLKSGLLYIQKNAHRLLRLVDQMLDLRKTDAGQQLLQASEQDVVQFLREIVTDFQQKAHKSKIDLQFITSATFLPLWFDAEKLDKVLFNLLSNAFKYTPKGGFIHVILQETAENVQIIIKDNGEGMSDTEKERAFDLYFSGQKKYSLGTGLGLALSREFVHLHHGEIEVTSTKNEGTTFDISLPKGDAHLMPDEKALLDKTERPTPTFWEETEVVLPTPAAEIADAATSVVLIEDNTDLSHYILDKLAKIVSIQSFTTAERGWEGILSMIPDLIICDVMLPGMDGFELTQRVKEDFRTSHIPVLLLTAKSQIDAKIEGSRAGADVYLTKPFNTTHLTETIKTMLNNRAKIQRRFSSEYVFTNENKIEKRFLNELTARIETHIADSEFSVEKLSTDMGMSRVQLYRKVHALLQMNVNDYITEIRINKAKALLRDTNKSIADVAYETGFNSAAYFTTLFRQKQQQTPSEFRKSVGV